MQWQKHQRPGFRGSRVPLICCALLFWSRLGAAEISTLYRNEGELILAPFASAPFPHPARAEGHRYRTNFYSAAEHYSDNTVALFIPKGFRETGQVDFVVHFHGWRNTVTNVLRQYRLMEQLTASGRNAVLIVPQGPRDAPDSFDGKLEDAGGFARFMTEACRVLREKSRLKKKGFRLGRIILSAHSGGYEAAAASVELGGLEEAIREVWLFDALYARTAQFENWQARTHGRLLDIWTEHGGTKDETEKWKRSLEAHGTPFISVNEAAATADALKSARLAFIYTESAHDEVLDKHDTFKLFLETSCLEPSVLK